MLFLLLLKDIAIRVSWNAKSLGKIKWLGGSL